MLSGSLWPGALLGRQIDVPRGHGQPIALPHGRHDDDGDIKSKISDHTAHDNRLLAIFLPEVGTVRLDRLNSLATTVATPRKWRGRLAPSRYAARVPGSTQTSWCSGPSGYIVITSGTNNMSTPGLSAMARSRSRSRG